MEDFSHNTLKKSLLSVSIKALNYSSRITLSNSLDVKLVLPSKNGHARDYRGLAELIGFQYSDIKKFERHDDTTMKILESWETHPDATFYKLISYLEEMERHDVIKELLPLLERNAETYLKNKQQDIPVQVSEVTSCPANTCSDRNIQVFTSGGCIYYDAYVSYADEDCEFVRELATYLESPDIGFKLFIRGRDMLAGCAELVTNIELIKNRCRQMLIILSPNFLKSPECEFQVSFAASLAIDQRQRMLIPVVLTPCEIPSILKYVSKIDFTMPDIQDWVWKKLINSLLPADRILTFQSSDEKHNITLKSQSTDNNPVITFPQTIKHSLPSVDNSNFASTSDDTSVISVENVLEDSTIVSFKVSSPKKWRFPLHSYFKKESVSSTASSSSSSNATSGFHSQSHNAFESFVESLSENTSV